MIKRNGRISVATIFFIDPHIRYAYKRSMRNIARGLIFGALFGAILIGGGGRVMMRVLALFNGLATGFSVDGTLDVLFYGALVGSAGGLLFAPLPAQWRSHWMKSGVTLGMLTFGATLLTLPSHIAETATPFADIMALVYVSFGTCFLAFGLALALALRPVR